MIPHYKNLIRWCSPLLFLLLSLLLLPLQGAGETEPAEDQSTAAEDVPLLFESSPLQEISGEYLDRDLTLLLEEGEAFFRSALSERDMEKARELYGEALLRFEWIVHEAGIQNGKLLYNIGNIYYLLGEIGKAILYYRRAEYYIPGDPNLRHNLRYLRSQRLDRFTGTRAGAISRILYSWGAVLAPRLKILLFAVSSSFLWSFATLFTLRKRKWMSLSVAVCSLATVFFLGSLIVHARMWRKNREGVIVVEEVVARRGDGDSYESSFEEPLHDGTEFRLIDERSGWYLIQLSEGSTGWIPLSSAELIHPRPGEVRM